jgi:hypothetical protein
MMGLLRWLGLGGMSGIVWDRVGKGGGEFKWERSKVVKYVRTGGENGREFMSLSPTIPDVIVIMIARSSNPDGRDHL